MEPNKLVYNDPFKIQITWVFPCTKRKRKEALIEKCMQTFYFNCDIMQEKKITVPLCFSPSDYTTKPVHDLSPFNSTENLLKKRWCRGEFSCSRISERCFGPISASLHPARVGRISTVSPNSLYVCYQHSHETAGEFFIEDWNIARQRKKKKKTNKSLSLLIYTVMWSGYFTHLMDLQFHLLQALLLVKEKQNRISCVNPG